MTAGSGCSSVSQQLWLLLLQLQADDSSPALASQAAAASERLAAACALSSSADLAAMHAPALIIDVTQASTLHQWQFRWVNARFIPCFLQCRIATIYKPPAYSHHACISVSFCSFGLKPCALLCLHMHYCNLLCFSALVYLWCSMQTTGRLTLLTVMSSVSSCSSAQAILCKSSCHKLCASSALLCKIQIGEHCSYTPLDACLCLPKVGVITT